MRAIKRRSIVLATTSATAFALILTGCSAPSGSGDIPAGCEAYADYQGNSGTEVEIYTTVVSPEAELFQESFTEFEDCTGITINWNGSKEFEAQLPVRVEGGTAPDLAVFPQPGLLAAMAATGKLLPASDAVAASVEANYSPDWKNYGTVDGTFYASPLGANVKSFVWYSPKTFKDNGWDIPTTWDELLALSDKIATTSDVQPWCAGFESGDATGWVGTDWMEDIVLRFGGAEVYDKWVSHEIPFNDPAIVEAIGKAGQILKNPEYVGDVPSIATTSFQTGGAGIVDGSCAMHRQASFIGGILVADQGATIVTPDDTTTEGGITTFYFPGATADDKPALGGGEFIGAFADRPEVQAVQLYLTTPEWNNKKAALGGWFSANLGLDTANVADPVNANAVEILKNATTFRFDGSDLMPAAVGAGSFWKEMTAWVAEDKSDKAVLDAIEASWPK
ncbi:MAG: carbohydrate ABC transporter substrate-binding protein [Microbacteriaceae bacterium]|jgi:alpha-glucoside transport system substrate-binding protein|nr:ABC transporter substrate-binding protein [Actinomycetota bacterium]MCC6855099.1 carbohydrate ABC transporter substrate-binding protein [Microbacteriaceae bacterium]HOB56755.1 ABC transporter substrate-binding protein [Rhodoglobus sp.]HOT33001.1 ABC transporter substrate-binding protein [Rhodoglobus sp.]HOW01036.1 ABC transporter substrate-binding protein [Rhodoglobus sp.]